MTSSVFVQLWVTTLCFLSHKQKVISQADQVLVCFLPGVPGSGPAPPLPLPVSSGLCGSAGLPTPAICNCVRRTKAHRPGWRQRWGNHLSDRRRLHSPVSAQKFHPAMHGSGSVWGLEREDEHLQCLQVRKVTVLLDDRRVMDGWFSGYVDDWLNIDPADT